MFKITKESCFFGALILVAITLPFSNLLVNTLSIWLMIFFWLINNSVKKKIELLQKNKLIWLFISLFLMYVIGLTYGDLKLGLFEVEKRLSLLIFPIVLGTSPPISSKQFKNILFGFAITSIAISMACLVNTFYTNYTNGISFNLNDRFFFTNLTENYGFHPSYFSTYLVFSIFIILKVGFQNDKVNKFVKLLLTLAIIYLVIFIFLLASRIGLISLLILSVCVLVIYFYKKRKLFYGLAITLVFTCALLFSLQFFTEINLKFKGLIHIGTENSEYSGSGIRLDLWQNTLVIIKENLLFGVGTGDLQPAIQEIFKTKGFSDPYQNHLNPHNKDHLNSHNQFLDITATLGILGILLFLLNVFYPFFEAFKRGNHLYIIFLTLFIFLCFVECSLATQKGVIFYAFFNSLFAFHSFKIANAHLIR